MRKPDFCLCENKGADQLCSNCTADLRLCFRYSDSKFLLFLNPKFLVSSIFSDCVGQFMLDLAGNTDWFSCVVAHII